MCPAAASADVETVAAVSIPQHYSHYPKEHIERADHVEGFFELGPREVHPYHKPAMPSQEQLQISITSPVIVTPNPMVKQQVRMRGWQRGTHGAQLRSGASKGEMHRLFCLKAYGCALKPYFVAEGCV
jgi:hypothetical protein